MTPIALLRLACLTAAACVSGEVQALTVAAVHTHDPRVACGAIGEAVEMMIGKRQRPYFGGTNFISDGLGHIDHERHAEFVAEMTSYKGNADRRPMQVEMVYPVKLPHPDRFSAIYVLRLSRDRWNDANVDEEGRGISGAGYGLDSSFWLASFHGYDLVEVREGDMFAQLADDRRPMKGCGNV